MEYAIADLAAPKASPLIHGLTVKWRRCLEEWRNADFDEMPMGWRSPPRSALIGEGKILEMPGIAKKVDIVRAPMLWANWVNRNYHYLRRPLPPRARPIGYAILFDGDCVGSITVATPQFPKMKYPEEHSQAGEPLFGIEDAPLSRWQVLSISRLWIHPLMQTMAVRDGRGKDHSFPLASASLAKLIRRIQWDWLEAHRPVDASQPYHIRLLLSFSDRGQGHIGAIYRAAGFQHWGISKGRNRLPGPRGQGTPTDKDRWAFWLPEPSWKYEQLALESLP